jgi:hypothetical protein
MHWMAGISPALTARPSAAVCGSGIRRIAKTPEHHIVDPDNRVWPADEIMKERLSLTIRHDVLTSHLGLGFCLG